MNEVEIAGAKYSIEKLDCMEQFHLRRRISPLAAVLFKAAQDRAGAIVSVKDTIGKMASFFSSAAVPFADVYANMPEDQINKIVFTCLSKVRRLADGAWVPVKTSGANSVMFDDLPIEQLVFHVIQENLSNFFHFAQAESTAPTP